MLDLTNAAIKAVETSGTVQSEVRDLLDEVGGIEKVCKAMSELKTWCETTYVRAVSPDEVLMAARRKQVNNVINDVSRIVRTNTGGYSIKCTQRTPEYVYELVPYTPRKKPEPEPLPFEPKALFEDKATFNGVTLPTNHPIEYVIAHAPASIMAEMFKKYDADRLKEIFKQAKEIVDTEENP